MKRLLTATLILLISAPVFANAFFEPQWNEFCPNQYANLDPEKDYILAEKKYWQQRKKDFDKKVSHCNRLVPEMRAACFNDLRQIESNASITHLQEQRLMQEQINASANMMNAANYQLNTINHTLQPYKY